MANNSSNANELWNKDVTPDTYPDAKQYQEHVLEQYKEYVATTQTVSAQRNNANMFFLSLHTLMLGALAFLLQGSIDFQPRILVVIPTLGAVSLCWAWARLIGSYSQLNRGKFAVIEEFEKKLPTAPFVSAEWSILGKGKDPSLYRPFTSVEKLIPWIFAGLYVLGAIAYVAEAIIIGQIGTP